MPKDNLVLLNNIIWNYSNEYENRTRAQTEW